MNEPYKDSFKEVFKDFLESENIILGDKTKEFENFFSDYCGTKFALGVSNGLDALKLILRGYIELGIFNEGDEILVPANTYIASILSISEAGLKPILVDADIKTYNVDFSKIEQKINKKTKGIMIVHLYGRLAISQKLYDLADQYNLKIIEDSAQAHGAIFDNKKAGNIGDASGFSFYPSKNLGAIGDAGGITTNDEELYEVVKYLRNYGSKIKYENLYKGFNNRIDEFQSAILIKKLEKLDLENSIRQNNAHFLLDNIKNSKIILPEKTDDPRSHVWHLFVIRIDDRDDMINYLNENNIGSLIHYPIPPHKQKAYLEIQNEHYPVSEKMHNTVLSLPSNIHVNHDELRYIVDICNEY